MRTAFFFCGFPPSIENTVNFRSRNLARAYYQFLEFALTAHFNHSFLLIEHSNQGHVS